jgi:protein involved in polysaccharide export with SLBB domain
MSGARKKQMSGFEFRGIIGIQRRRLALRALYLALFAQTLGAVTGCANSKAITRTGEWPAPPASVLKLGPGDEVDIKFRYWPDLDQTATVRPDGRISLQLVDDVEVAGLTPADLDQKLTKLYEAQLNDAVLTVMVRSINKQRVFVGGEVKNPGLIAMPGRLTVLEAIMQAGSFDREHAKMSNVVVIRHVDGKRYARLVDMEKALNETVTTDEIELAANDIVYVPRTKISKADQWVDQHINKLIPDIVENALQFFVFTGASGN